MQWSGVDVRRRFPLVKRLFGAHLNLDWREDYDSVEEVYRVVLDTAGPNERDQLLTQLEMLGRLVQDDDELSAILEVSGSGFMPEYDAGLAPLAWLAALTERVRHPHPVVQDAQARAGELPEASRGEQ